MITLKLVSDVHVDIFEVNIFLSRALKVKFHICISSSLVWPSQMQFGVPISKLTIKIL